MSSKTALFASESWRLLAPISYKCGPLYPPSRLLIRCRRLRSSRRGVLDLVRNGHCRGLLWLAGRVHPRAKRHHTNVDTAAAT